MRFNPSKALADVDLTGRVILITGSTSGIGFATAQVLVQYGAKVYLAARNPEKAASCIRRIEESLAKSSDGHPKGRALFHQIDLQDPKDAKRSAEAFIEKEQRLDILINCAAAIGDVFKLCANGIQNTMNVNYFSPFVLTDTLLPLLKKTAAEPNSDVRIVNLSAEGHRLVSKDFHFASKEDFNITYGDSFRQSLKRYEISKLADVLWTKELQRRLTEEGTNIIVISVHPGIVYTESADNASLRFSWPLSSILLFFARVTFMSVADGAGTPIIAAVSPTIRAEAEKYKGSYLVPMGKLSEPSKQAQNEDLARELWETTENLVKEWGL